MVKRILIIIIMFILLAGVQGASAHLTINTTDKFLESNGVKKFMVGSGTICGAYVDANNPLGESCDTTISHNPEMDFQYLYYEGFSDGNSTGNDIALNNSGIYWMGERGTSANSAYWKNVTYWFGLSHNDEPDLDGIPIADMITNYTAMKESDPNHPTFVLLYGKTGYSLNQVINTSDIFAWDRYPKLNSETSYQREDHLYAWDYLSNVYMTPDGQDIETWSKPAMCFVNSLNTTFSGVYPADLADIRGTTYMCVITGAKGVAYWPNKAYAGGTYAGYYSNATMYNYINNVLAAELHSFDWIFVNSTAKSWEGHEDFVSVNFTNNTDKEWWDANNFFTRQFSYILKNKNTTTDYLISVNKDQNATVTQISIPSLSGTRNATTIGLQATGTGAAGTVHTVINGNFTDTFDGYAVHIYKISTDAAPPAGNATTWTIRGSGGDATWSQFTSDNVVENKGSHNLNVGQLADDYSDNNQDLSLFGFSASDVTVSGGVLNITNGSALTSTHRANYSLNITNASVYYTGRITVGEYIGSIFRLNDAGKWYSNFYDINDATNTKSHYRYYEPVSITIGLDNDTVTDIQLSTYYNFKQKACGESFSNSINGTEMDNVTNNSLPGGGYVGYTLSNKDSTGSIEIDNIRVLPLDSNCNEITSGNYTSSKNWTDSNVTYQIVVNATTPTNTNYSVNLYSNGTGAFIESLGTNLTGNQSLSIISPIQDSKVNVTLYGNETTTPELMAITYYAQAPEVSSTSTKWIYGIEGQVFHNNSIGSNRTCINQGDGSIGICKLADNFNDNNTIGWNETGDLTGTWILKNGSINQSTTVSSYQYWNVTSYENLSIFTKFKNYNNLTSYVDAGDLRGNLSRTNANPSWLNCQFSIGSPTSTRAYIYCYNGSAWLVVNNTATKTRYLNEWNYAGFFVNGTTFKGYMSNVSYADAMTSVLSSGTSSQWLNGTTIQFGGAPQADGIIGWDEIRAVELDALGNQYLSGNYSMNYIVPASQYAKNITVNGSYPSNTNYSLWYRQNGTGSYVAVDGVKTANVTIELPTPYYHNIDMILEMNATESDTLWIQNVTIGTSSVGGSADEYMPPTPVIGTVTTGNFWKNITYSADSGNITDSYNILRNGTWYNGTALFLNTSTVAHGWINDTIYAYNSSGNGTLGTSVTNNTQIPNNIPSNITLLTPLNGTTITSIPSNLTWNGTDADGDTLKYELNVNGIIVLTGITTNYTSYNFNVGNNNWSIRSYDAYTYSNWSNVSDIKYNLINFTFSNISNSEGQIYQSSQATVISVDVNDSDGYITGVDVGVTFLGVEFNYTMAGGNDTWTYSFKSGVAGTYTVSNFYATDNASGTNSSASSLSFVVVPGTTGGSAAPAANLSGLPLFANVSETIQAKMDEIPADNILYFITVGIIIVAIFIRR